MTDIQLFSSEHLVSTALVTVELRRYHRQHLPQHEFEFCSDSHAYLDLAVTPRITSHGRLGTDDYRWHPLGEILVVPPDTEFVAMVPPGICWDQTSLSCLLSRQLLDAAAPATRWSAPTLACCTNLNSPSLRADLSRMMNEIRHPGFASTAILESLATLIAVDMVRSLSLCEARAAPKGGLTVWRHRILQERIETDSLPPPGINELAGLIGLSGRQLMRAFREDTGTSLGLHIREQSILRAKRMLAASHDSIKHIALSLGFCSTASFSHAFRKATGLRPAEYRQLPFGGKAN